MIASVSPSMRADAPNASTMSTTAARRSTSLTRSSPTSEKTVVPSATAAATARIGISSSEGISAAATSVAFSGWAVGRDADGRGVSGAGFPVGVSRV